MKKYIFIIVYLIILSFAFSFTSYAQSPMGNSQLSAIQQPGVIQTNIFEIELQTGNSAESRTALFEELKSIGAGNTLLQEKKNESIIIEVSELQLRELRAKGYEPKVLRQARLFEKRKETAAQTESSQAALYIYGENGTNVSIPDNNSNFVATSQITISGAPSGALVTTIDVHFEVIHTYVSDLEIILNSVDNAGGVWLWQREGGSGVNINKTFTGVTNFQGNRVNENWGIWARDLSATDVGYIDYWWIKVYYDGGTVPVPPILLSPANGSTVTTDPVTLDWSTVSGATEYWVQVSTSSSFSSSVYSASTGTLTDVSLTGFISGTTYYWRAQAKNGSGWGSYSAAWSFTYQTVPPPPTLVSPASGTSVTTDPVILDWNNVTGATEYWVQVSTNSSFSTTVLDATAGTTSQISLTGFIDGTTYYWKVKAKNSSGWGAYSFPWNFIYHSPPVPPSLVSPTNSSTVTTDPVVLDWNTVTGATEYWLQVSTSSSFSTTVYDASTQTYSEQSLTGFVAGTTYYWRVKAKNSSGWGAYSSPWSFLFQPPPATITSISPNKTSAGTDSQVTITGTNFGATRGTGKVYFFYKTGSPKMEATVDSWSNTQISLKVPIALMSGYPGSAGSGPVTVINNSGHTSNDYSFKVSFGYGGAKWANSTINYRINENAPSCTGEGQSVQNCTSRWSQAGANFRLNYSGTHTNTDVGQNSYNDIMWGPISDPNIIGQASILASGGIITECDFKFNNSLSWSTAPQPTSSSMDVETIAQHELGHWLNLRDLYGNIGDGVNDNGKIMYGFSDYGLLKRNLTADDIAGIIWIYGQGSPCNITANPTSLTIPATGGSQTSVINSSSCNWTLSTSPSSGLTVTPTFGQSGNTTITATAPSNTSGQTKSWTISITGASGGSATINVTQGYSPCTISANPVALTIPTGGGSQTSVINSSSCNWTLSTSPSSGLTVTPTSGQSGNTTITATAPSNTSGQAKSWTITITGTSGGSATINVTQGYNPCIISTNPTILTIPSGGGSQTTIINSSQCNWTLATSPSSGLTVTPTSGQSGNTTVTASTPANTSGQSKLWTVTITGASGGSAQFTVNQQGPGASIKPVSPATAISGSDFWVDITVGDPYAVNNLFGTGFNLSYNRTYLTYSTSEAGSWFGNDLVFFATNDAPNGNVSIGISRKADAVGVSGTGVIARVKFTSLASTPNNTDVDFTLSNITANDPAGTTINLIPSPSTTRIGIPGVVVWPGDTNNDGIVNIADVLPIGLYWAKQGTARPNASNNWIGQTCPPWSPEISTYADANGDGVVSASEILVIGLNWGKTHTYFSKSSIQDIVSSSATLSIDNIVSNQKEFYFNLKFDNKDKSLKNISGLSFEADYGDMMKNTEEITIYPDIYFNGQMINYSHPDKKEGKISFGTALIQKTADNLEGNPAVTVKIKLAELNGYVNLKIKDIKVMTVDGSFYRFEDCNINLNISDLVDKETMSGYPLVQNYPNPFNPSTSISYELPVESFVSLKIYNAIGQEVRSLVYSRQQPGKYKVDFNASNLPSGIYFYLLNTGKFSEVKKMILQK